MKRLLFAFFLIPLLSLSQVQIGQDINGETINDFSGWSTSMSSDGTIVAIGAPRNDGNGESSGHVRVYENVMGLWTQIGQDIDGEATNDQSGSSVSLSSDGSIVAIGAPENIGNGEGSGHVRVYENIAGVWTQIGQDIDSESNGDLSGWSVSLSADGSVVAVGAIGNDGNGESSGHVRLYENIAGAWTQLGQDIDGEVAGGLSGWSVSLSSNGAIVAIGAQRNDGNGMEAGHVRVFENISGVWTQIGEDLEGESEFDHFGWSVSMSSDGSIIAIGALDNSEGSGHVRIFENISGEWTQIGEDIEGETELDNSGGSVSLSGDGGIVAIGAASNNENGELSGHVRIFENISGVWTQKGDDINGEASFDQSGYSVTLSNDGSTVAIGALNNGDNGYGSGHVRIFDLTPEVSIEEQSLANFKLSPNPTINQFKIQLNSTVQLENVTIYNTMGQVVLSTKKTIVNTSKLSSGIYTVEVLSNLGKTTKQLIKQ